MDILSLLTGIVLLSGNFPVTIPQASPVEINVSTKEIKPNDGIDDAGRINQLINSMKGGVLYFPNGTYNISAPILLKSGITLKGKSRAGVIFKQTGSVGKWEGFAEQGIVTTNPNLQNNNVHVISITVQGIYKKAIDEHHGGGKGGVCLRNCRNSSVEFVTTYDTWHGVAMYDYSFADKNSNNVISNVKAVRANSHSQKGNSGRPRGILMNTPHSLVKGSIAFACGTGFFASGDDITLRECKAENWTIDNGYYIMVNNVTVMNCMAVAGPGSKQGLGSGIVIAYSKGGVVQNCKAKNCSNYGFRIHVPQSDLKLSYNLAEKCGIGFGIENASHEYPEMCKNLSFIDNTSLFSNLQGFLFRQMEYSVVTGNIARNNNQKGITLATRGGMSIANYCFNNKFEDNTCDDDQVKKTQLFGLYDYNKNTGDVVTQTAGDAARSAAKAVRKSNNIIKHKSRYGQDYF